MVSVISGDKILYGFIAFQFYYALIIIANLQSINLFIFRLKNEHFSGVFSLIIVLLQTCIKISNEPACKNWGSASLNQRLSVTPWTKIRLLKE